MLKELALHGKTFKSVRQKELVRMLKNSTWCEREECGEMT